MQNERMKNSCLPQNHAHPSRVKENICALMQGIPPHPQHITERHKGHQFVAMASFFFLISHKDVQNAHPVKYAPVEACSAHNLTNVSLHMDT